eukprot:gnl/MRDRNA2_/MRDRNA2_230411_c0_seq1.p1 gnl/MRDRNA2_/MRDRNA2_230411_c0~~gnl/MRDRNA2_/MRDRNA2_230411_c0_seq1.p1  ORF type:complete len:227 (-),score=39.51 gnl/MRDRNA2_/MRDRNA2_230411_c0_seq1:76-756(-)
MLQDSSAVLRGTAFRAIGKLHNGWTFGWRSLTQVPSRSAVLNSYGVLGLSPSASLLEIKAAYQRCILQTHPDHGGSSASFRRTLEAYRTLLRVRPKHGTAASSDAFTAKTSSSNADVEIALKSQKWNTGRSQLIRWTTPPVARRIDVLLQRDELQTWTLAYGFQQDRHSTEFTCEVELPRRLSPGRYFIHLYEVMSDTEMSGLVLATAEVFINVEPPVPCLEQDAE